MADESETDCCNREFLLLESEVLKGNYSNFSITNRNGIEVGKTHCVIQGMLSGGCMPVCVKDERYNYILDLRMERPFQSLVTYSVS